MHRSLLVALVAAVGFTQPAPAQTARPAPAAVVEQLRKPNTILLDVRTPAEFASGHLRGAHNLDFRASNFREQLAQLDKSKTYVLYCASGNRSGQTNTLLLEAGFRKVVDAGAYQDLKAAGLQVAE